MNVFEGCNLWLVSSELFSYLEATNASRNFLEGEQVLNSGLLVLCGITNVNQTKCEIFALCLQTSALMGNPHEISGSLNFKSNILSINNFICTCKAGKGGKCKHVAAVLIYFTRNKVCDVELISQTDIRCQWKLQKTKKLSSFQPVPWLETQCMKKKIDNNEIPYIAEDQKEFIRNKLIIDNPASALAQHKKRKRKELEFSIEITTRKYQTNFCFNEEHDILKQINSIAINAKICCMETYCDLYNNCDTEKIMFSTFQDETKWFQERQFRITGSRCYELYTYSKGDWEMKSKKYFWPKRLCTPAMNYGKNTEKIARAIYKSRLQYKVVETGLIVSKLNPWLGFSPDGIILDSENRPIKLLEIKCPVAGQNKSALECFPDLEYLKIINNKIRLNPKHKYYGQVQMGMCILNVKTCDFIVYSSKNENFLNILVDFDEVFVNSLITKLKENYFMYMLHELCKDRNKQ